MNKIESMMERRDRLLGKAYRLFYEQPIHIMKGEGVWLTDADGNKYLDCYNNVPHVGHCHPHVVEAICRQAGTLNTHTRYLHETVLEYAEMLTARFPDGLDIAMFACTGTEANELALRIARATTGGEGMIAMEDAYHGNSWAIAQITASYESGEPKKDNIVFIPSPDTYRGEHRGEDAANQYAGYVSEAIDTLRQRGHQPCAIIVDTIFSSNGLPDLPKGYLRKAVDIVHDAGGVFVADEVQPGFGRTGTNFWGYQNHDVEPDLVTMGKPMGNGHPISAVVTSADVIDTFEEKGRYFNTFGGNPVSCAAAKAVLEVIDAENLQQNALDVGNYIREQLADLAERHECIGDIRGAGLFNGVDLVTNRETREPDTDLANRVYNGMKDRGVLIGTTGRHENILKMRSPLVFSQNNADVLLECLDETLRGV